MTHLIIGNNVQNSGRIFDVQKKFHEYIKLDLEDEIPDPRIKNMLLGLLKN